MEIGKKILSITLFIIIAFVILNQLVKLSVFAYKYYNNYTIASINNKFCGNYFSESEHPRFQISKSIYDLHIDNDLFNSKTYMIIIYIFSIIFYIYAFSILISAFEDDTFSNNYNVNTFITVLLSILPLVYFIAIIAIRFEGGDENGYKRLYAFNDTAFNDQHQKYYIEIIFYTLIAFLIFIKLLLLFIPNRENLEPGIFIYLLFVAAFYIFTLYFMKNILNIILSFRNNEYPLNKGGSDGITELETYYSSDKTNLYYYNNVDISYGSENYFYRKYLEYSKIPYFDIFTDLHDINKIGYNNVTSYNISNLKDEKDNSKAIYTGNLRAFILVIIIIMTCAVLIYGIVSFADQIINKNYLNYDRIKKYFILIGYDIILPLFILLIIIFVIIATMEYNTMINKDILIDINKKYKEDLNNLNNSLLPVLYTKDKELIDDNDAIKYSYIIYNVMSSYIINTINIFDNSSQEIIKDENDTSKYNKTTKTVTIIYTINDTISCFNSTYNIDETIYNTNYYNDLSEDKIKNDSITLSDNITYSKEDFNKYVNYIEGYTPYNDDVEKIIKHYNNIFLTDKNLDNLDYIKINMKNNILYSMYNIDNFSDINDDEKANYFRNYIFKKVTTPVTSVYFNEFLLKANLEDKGVDLNKYKIYHSYIDEIIYDFIYKLGILNDRVPQYSKIVENKDDNDINSYNTEIKGAFKDIKSNLKDSLNNMIEDFTNINGESNNKLFRDIEVNYKRINNEDNDVKFRAFDLTTTNADGKFTNYIKEINNKTSDFNNKSMTNIKNHKDEIDLLKHHDNIVKNSNFVINERLYVLISTYLISLFIAYKLVKN